MTRIPMAFPARISPPRLSHVWLLVCNVGIFALAICILASCRSPSEANYSLLNFDRPFLKKIIGDKCFGASEGVAADIYRVGLAGACRVTDGTMTCEGRGPKLDWVTLFEADLATTNTTDEHAVALEECIDTLHGAEVDHSLTGKLATALFALLIVSTILDVGALVAAFISGSGFALPVFIIGLIDEVLIITCIGLFIGIINHEVGEYIPPSVNLGDIDDMAALGIGFWMLVTLLGVRVISHPLLFVLTLIICLLIVVIPIFLLLCCLGGDSREKTTVYVKTKVEYIWGSSNLGKEPEW